MILLLILIKFTTISKKLTDKTRKLLFLEASKNTTLDFYSNLTFIFDADNFKEDFELSQEYYKKIDTDLISYRKF